MHLLSRRNLGAGGQHQTEGSIQFVHLTVSGYAQITLANLAPVAQVGEALHVDFEPARGIGLVGDPSAIAPDDERFAIVRANSRDYTGGTPLRTRLLLTDGLVFTNPGSDRPQKRLLADR